MVVKKERGEGCSPIWGNNPKKRGKNLRSRLQEGVVQRRKWEGGKEEEKEVREGNGA